MDGGFDPLFVASLGLVWYISYSITRIILDVDYRDKGKTTLNRQNYQRDWRFITRVYSTIHALLVSGYALFVVSNHGWTDLTDWNLCTWNSSACQQIEMINSLMMSYLVVDAIFLLLYPTDSNYLPTVIHHIVGSLSMLQFMRLQIMHYNSVYYAITELSTITLNISWWLLTFHYNETSLGKTAFKCFGYLTVFLFFTIRIIGSLFLMRMVYLQSDLLIGIGFTGIAGGFGANAIVTVLNFYWFYKLVAMAVETT